MIECRRKIGRVRITENTQVFCYVIRNNSSHVDFNAAQGFEYEPPQIRVELVEVNYLIECRSRTKVARSRIFERDEIRAQSVVSDSL